MQKSCSGTRKPRQPEGLELNPSLSIRPGRPWLPIETRRRRNHLGAGGEEDRAIRRRGLSGRAHSDGLRGEGGHRSVVLKEGQAEWRLDPAGVCEEKNQGKLHCRGFPTTRSLREAWPEGAYVGTKQPQRERQRRALRQKIRREDSETVSSADFELGEHKTSRHRSVWSSGHWQR